MSSRHGTPGERPTSSQGAAREGASAGLAIRSPKRFSVKSLLSRPAEFTGVCWTCNGDSLLSGSSDGAVKLLEPSSGKVEWQFNVTAGASHVDVLAANPTNSRHAAVALSDPSKRGDSAVVAHFDVRSSKHSGKADVQDSIGNPALAMAWHPGGTRLGVARRNGKLSIYDIRKLGSKARAVCEETLAWELNKFLFVGDGDRLVASYGHQQRGGFRVLKAADLSPVTAAECHLMPCVGLALSQDGALLATGGNDAIVTVWDTSRNVIVNSIYQIDYPCNNVSISHDGSWLAYTGATEKGRAVSVEVAERFADPGESPQIHRLTADAVTMGSSTTLTECAVTDISWSPKAPVLAFCGRSGDQAHVGCVAVNASAPAAA